jgi:hypothetical protein
MFAVHERGRGECGAGSYANNIASVGPCWTQNVRRHTRSTNSMTSSGAALRFLTSCLLTCGGRAQSMRVVKVSFPDGTRVCLFAATSSATVASAIPLTLTVPHFF